MQGRSLQPLADPLWLGVTPGSPGWTLSQPRAPSWPQPPRRWSALQGDTQSPAQGHSGQLQGPGLSGGAGRLAIRAQHCPSGAAARGTPRVGLSVPAVSLMPWGAGTSCQGSVCPGCSQSDPVMAPQGPESAPSMSSHGVAGMLPCFLQLTGKELHTLLHGPAPSGHPTVVPCGLPRGIRGSWRVEGRMSVCWPGAL